MLSVAIAVEPPAESAPAVDLAVKSCERAIGSGRCRSAEGATTATVVAWYAVIVVDTETSTLTIRFHDRKPEGILIETRAMAFTERDNAESRWASAGAVIAAFVAARDSGAPPPPPLSPAPPPPPVEPAPAPVEPERPLPWNIDLALFSGSALDRGPLRWGALARGYLALPQAPSVLGLVSLRYSERPGDLSLAWYGASFGLGARAHFSPFSAELTGEVAFEHLQLEAEDPARSASDSTSQNRFGGRLSVNLGLDLSSHLALVAGAEVSAMRPSIAVLVADDDVGSVPAVAYGFSVGVRLGVWGGAGSTTSEK
jgi:hypothetical protein